MNVHLYKKGTAKSEWCKPFVYVCFPWLMGLLAGALIALRLSDSGLIVVRLMAATKASVFGVLCTSLIPFLFVAMISRFAGRIGLQAYLFLNSTVLGLTICYCARCFGTAAWLLVPLLFITEIFCSYCLLLLSFRLFTSRLEISKSVFFQYSGLSVMLGMINYFVLSPFTASLF